MQGIRILGSTLGLLVVANACATTANTGSLRYAAAPASSAPSSSRASIVAFRDSVIAQELADQEGPRVAIRANFSNVNGSRRVQGTFSLDDDAFVLVGHIDGNGTLRIVFPSNPGDDGFVKGSKTYRTPEFFAGFNDDFRSQFAAGRYRPMVNNDSYDRGLGYMFVVASWRPMRFDRFSSENQWDSFEVSDESYLKDPRPAIHEMATLLAGENREAYTVRFARYSSTQALYAGGFGSTSALGLGYCSAYGLNGFGSSAFGFGSFGFDPFGLGSGSSWGLSGYGSSFWSRGTLYSYDSFAGCYRPASNSYYRGNTGIATGPTPYNPPSRPRLFDPESHRTPLTPREPVRHTPVVEAPANGNETSPPISPRYRERGLITADDPAPRQGRREPRIDARSTVEDRTRPPIQEMVSHRVQDANGSNDNGSGRNDNSWARAQRARDTDQRGGNSSSSDRPRYQGNSGSGTSDSRGGSSTEGRREAPAPRVEQPVQRSEPVQRSVPAAEPRSAPASPPAAPPSGTPVTPIRPR